MSAPQSAKGTPERIGHEGRYVRLEPLAPGHAEDLYAASIGVPERYRWLYNEPPQGLADMQDWVAAAAVDAEHLYFGVIDKTTGRCEGRQSFMRCFPNDGSIEIGGIYWGPRLARTRMATEALFLFARHAFDDLGYRRFEWKCNDRNEPSKAAALRFGFTFEGVFRQAGIVKGENRDTAWFSIIDLEWPARRAEFERWLAPDNFEPDGSQRTPLLLRIG